VTAEQRIARALYEIERQRTSGEWSLCKVRDLLTGDEPAALRIVEERALCEPKGTVWFVDPAGALYTPPTENTELLATSQEGPHVWFA
jgi:hypothetical protein